MGADVQQTEPLTPSRQRELRRMRHLWMLQNLDRYTSSRNPDRLFGTENEFLVLDRQGHLVPHGGTLIVEELKETIKNKEIWTPEMGSWQLELVLGPYRLERGVMTRLEQETRSQKSKMIECAQSHKNSIIAIGLAPRLDLESLLNGNDALTPKPRYQLSTRYFQNKGYASATIKTKSKDEIVIRDEKAATLINSIHVQLQAIDHQDALDIFNYSQMLVAPIIALTANSGILNGKELSKRNYQVPIFEEMDRDVTNGLQRAGLFPGYLRSVDQYFNVAFSFDPIYDAIPDEACPDPAKKAFMLAEGSYFPWVRLRVGDTPEPHLRIEFRSISMQPTSSESTAVTQFYLIHLLDMVEKRTDLLPFKFVQENLDEAVTRGMNAKIWVRDGSIFLPVTMSQYLIRAVESAKDYASRHNILTEEEMASFDLIKARAIRKTSPASQLIAHTRTKGFDYALESYIETCMTDLPYIKPRGKFRFG